MELIRRKLQAWEYNALTGDKKACVALLIRNGQHHNDTCENPELFFILRAQNPQDRWSGQVGLPGGRQENGECDLETAKREVQEEVGICVDDYFDLWGRIDDRVFVQSGSRLVVACFVFGERYPGAGSGLTYTIDAEEIASCGWTPLHNLVAEGCGEPLLYPMQESQVIREFPLRYAPIPLSWLCLDKVVFTKVKLQMTEVACAGTLSEPPAFILWGMTLGMVNDMLHASTGLRNNRINARGRLFGSKYLPFVDSMYASKVHNAALYVFKPVLRAALQHEPNWSETVSWYSIAVECTVIATVLHALQQVSSKL